jgi:hypothetical protein
MSDWSRFHTPKEACGIERLAPERRSLSHSYVCAHAQRGSSDHFYLFLEGVAEAALYCAHRTSTVSSCAFCEQEGHLGTPSPSFRGRTFREQEDDQATSPFCFRAPWRGCRGRRGSERAHPSFSSDWSISDGPDYLNCRITLNSSDW